MNEMQIFNNPEFGEIRTVEIDGQPWFVGNDVATILGYAVPKNAIRQRVDNEDKLGHSFGTSGQRREMIIINESGLYSLIFGSKLESAKKFKRWVTSEVLPTLHRKGTYTVPQVADENKLDILYMHYEAIVEVDKKVKGVQSEVLHINNRVDTMQSEFEQFKGDLPLLGIEESQIICAVEKKAIQLLGGRRSNAYKTKGMKKSVSSYIYGELHRMFGIKTYKALKRKHSDKALEVIRNYVPPIEFQDVIELCNAQMKLDLRHSAK